MFRKRSTRGRILRLGIGLLVVIGLIGLLLLWLAFPSGNVEAPEDQPPPEQEAPKDQLPPEQKTPKDESAPSKQEVAQKDLQPPPAPPTSLLPPAAPPSPIAVPPTSLPPPAAPPSPLPTQEVDPNYWLPAEDWSSAEDWPPQEEEW
jgi:cytoskeletal protein RodZ